MAHLVTIAAGVVRVSLPNGLTYTAGDQVLLSSYQYSRLSWEFKQQYLSSDVTEITMSGGTSSGVSSVFGRTGHVMPEAGDYAVGDVTGAASSGDLTAEAARAEAAEGQEASRAEAAEAGFASAAALTSEASRAAAAEAAVSAAVSAETARAQQAESGLASSSSVTAEATRAQGAEALLASQASLSAEVTRATGAESALAPKASPVFTGTPTAPTAAAGTATAQLATTAFVASAVSALGPVLGQVRSTTAAGFPLSASGTSVIFTWTAPADGAVHTVQLIASLAVSVLEIGGVVQLAYTDPGGTPRTANVFSAGLGVGPQPSLIPGGIMVAPGSAVTLSQTSLLTIGAATLWARLYAS